MKSRLMTFFLALSLTACAGIPERNVPDDVVGTLPDRFTEVLVPEEPEIPVEWWKAFDDPQLDRLVERGLNYNSDLVIAAQRLREARAVFRSSRANQLPDIGVFIDGTRERAPLIDPSSVVESGSYGVSVGYEADLWGRLAAQTSAERQRYLAQGYTLAALRLTIAAELVRGYLQGQALIDNRAVLEENVQVLEDQLRLSRRRYDLGAISDLDLQRFRSELEDSRAQLAEVTQQERETERALLVLAGEMPTKDALLALGIRRAGAAPASLPTVPTGLPSSLLTRRPDLRAAESDLAGAGADLMAAKRAWFPNLVITGAAGEVSGNLSNLFDDGLSVWSITASLTQAIFDGGRRSAAIEATDARREQLVETYRDTVRGAFTEVVDALDARSSVAEIHRARTAQSAALETALRLAQRRYDEGYSDYLGVLDARRSLLQSRLAVAEARRSGGAAYVDLALAVGGGWDPGQELAALERTLQRRRPAT
jgi:NodT family efflux transporter outer membrane factor (OMF) lipoprotein